ncbi:uncharacterized protein [Ciconia boyciana]|uniref:uncharacterized protein n=1 Tax=Ciconia boyciana TaxID=52775 RepID=UPI003BA1D92E
MTCPTPQPTVRCTRATARQRKALTASPGSPFRANEEGQRRIRIPHSRPLAPHPGQPSPRDRAPVRRGLKDTKHPLRLRPPLLPVLPQRQPAGAARSRYPQYAPTLLTGASGCCRQRFPGAGRRAPASSDTGWGRQYDAPTTHLAHHRIRPPSSAAAEAGSCNPSSGALTSLRRTPKKPLADQRSPQRPARAAGRPAHPPSAAPAQSAFEKRSPVDVAAPAAPARPAHFGRREPIRAQRGEPSARRLVGCPPTGERPRPAALVPRRQPGWGGGGAGPLPAEAAGSGRCRLPEPPPGPAASWEPKGRRRGGRDALLPFLLLPRCWEPRPCPAASPPARGAGPGGAGSPGCLGAGGGPERGRALPARPRPWQLQESHFVSLPRGAEGKESCWFGVPPSLQSSRPCPFFIIT